MQPVFLNVDLDIESNSKLDSLAADMGKRVWVLHSGPGTKKRHLLTLELGSGRRTHGPGDTIRRFCAIVEKLPPSYRKIWNRAEKVFDIGMEESPSSRYSRFKVETETLKLVTMVGASLAVTYYQANLGNAPHPTNKRP